jgi:phosphoribosyl 1,2-cyclic phosphate phosphodiesterase
MIDCEIVILGCGGSGGVPLATGYWGNCNPDNPKNRRTRASIAVRTKSTCIVIDTGADFHAQTIANNISNIDAVIYTHDHADHVNGIDDTRYIAIQKRIKGDDNYRLPIYADKATMRSIQHTFDYLFKISKDGLYIPLLDTYELKTGQITIGDIQMTSFYQVHGSGRSIGFKIGDVGYSTDVSNIDDATLKELQGIKTWIVDCGQFGSETKNITVHPNFERVLKWNEVVRAEHLYLTHLTPKHDYDVINSETPHNVEAAYDGMSLKTKI